MKKLINAPDTRRRRGARRHGRGARRPDPGRSSPTSSCARTRPKPGKVGVISGGGSGHEPMHGGFVGHGHARCRLPGRRLHLARPGPDAGRHQGGRRRRRRPPHRQELHRRHHELRARGRDGARPRGSRSPVVVIADDVAVKDSLYTAGRRGVGGTVLAEKIVGAAAEAGADLETVTALCQKVQDNVRSMGMALTSCTVPAAGKPTFELGDDEMEIGDRHPRRAGPDADEARHRRRDHRDARRRRSSTTCPFKSRRHASSPSSTAWAARRSSSCTSSSTSVNKILKGRGDHDRPQPRRQLHHLARDGRLLDHAAPARRRADQVLGRAGQHAGPALGA